VDEAAPPDPAVESDPIRARRFLVEAWQVYRREILLVLPAAVAARLSVVVAAVFLVEIPSTVLHLLTDEAILEAVDDDIATDLWVGALMATMWATLGHHFLSGVLERVVAADRHGHDRPTLRQTFAGLPWGRLIVGDLILGFVLTALASAFVLPRLLLGPFLLCVMPLLSMRHENLRTVWLASVRLVRGSWWPVALAFGLALFLETVVLQGGGQLVEEVTHSHTLELVAHGLLGLLVLPFTALVPVVITFDLLDKRHELPDERY